MTATERHEAAKALLIRRGVPPDAAEAFLALCPPSADSDGGPTLTEVAAFGGTRPPDGA